MVSELRRCRRGWGGAGDTQVDGARALAMAATLDRWAVRTLIGMLTIFGLAPAVVVCASRLGRLTMRLGRAGENTRHQTEHDQGSSQPMSQCHAR